MRVSGGPSVEPAEVGLCPRRLARLDSLLADRVAHRQVTGAVAAIYRGGQLAHVLRVGVRDPAVADPLPAEPVFRIYSMTKPIVAVAALSLCEEGRLRLDDPVQRHLPEFADVRVWPRPYRTRHGRPVTVPPRTPVTVQDLMRHTSGIVGGKLGSQRVLRYYRAAGLVDFEHAAPALRHTNAEFVARLTEAPLAHHPGTVWEYGYSWEVLGRLLEVVCGESLDRVIAERVLTPLGLTDTGFAVIPTHVHRVVEPLSPAVDDLRPQVLDRPPTRLSAGSGCYSTVSDYLRLTRMLLNGGEVDGCRVLGRKSVELMVADHLATTVEPGADYIPGPGYGFGLGVAVRRNEGGHVTPGSPGEFWWLGRAATSFFVDRREELIGILMMQHYWQARPYAALFRTLVNQAVVA